MIWHNVSVVLVLKAAIQSSELYQIVLFFPTLSPALVGSARVIIDIYYIL